MQLEITGRHEMDHTVATLRIDLLGGFGVDRDGIPVPDFTWQRRSARRLTKLLATVPNHSLHREQIIDIFWPNADVDSARNSLAKALHAARRAVEPERPAREDSSYLIVRDDLVSLDPDHVLVDADEFQRLALLALRTGTMEAFDSALRRYTGALLPEDLYEDWPSNRRLYLAELHVRLLLGLANALAEVGAHDEAVDRLQNALLEDPARRRPPSGHAFVRGDGRARAGHPAVPDLLRSSRGGTGDDAGTRDHEPVRGSRGWSCRRTRRELQLGSQSRSSLLVSDATPSVESVGELGDDAAVDRVRAELLARLHLRRDDFEATRALHRLHAAAGLGASDGAPQPTRGRTHPKLRVVTMVAVSALLVYLTVLLGPGLLFYLLFVAVSLAVGVVCWTTLVWMVYAWRSPAAFDETRVPAAPLTSFQSFSLIVPARHEEQVLAGTLAGIVATNHPHFEILVVVGDDDPETRAVAETVAAAHPDLVRVIVDSSIPKNKPKALNAALPYCRGDVVGVFDAEDEVHPELLGRVDQCFQETGADVVQGGVQLDEHPIQLVRGPQCTRVLLLVPQPPPLPRARPDSSRSAATPCSSAPACCVPSTAGTPTAWPRTASWASG